MESDGPMTVPVLDCLANLSLPRKLLSHATDSVLNMVASCDRDDLPAVVRFLLMVCRFVCTWSWWV